MKKPKIEAPQSVRFGEGDLVRQTRVYQVMTPIFGGGIEAGKPDTELPVNGKTIRGQLRFWWRVMRAGNDKSLEETFDMESVLWGAAASKERNEKNIGPSRVQIHVQILDAGKLESPFTTNQKGRVVAAKSWEDLVYFAFPLQPDSQNSKPVSQVLSGVKFELEIAFEEQWRPNVEAALWAWETFGGVGARTRRGFGALRLISITEAGKTLPISLPQDGEAVSLWMQTNLQRHQKKGKAALGLPVYSSSHFLKGCDRQGREFIWCDATQEIWRGLSCRYKSFRQTKFNDKPQGRSCWPEADEIRYANDPNPDFKEMPFPRSVLGLPILFHFQKQERLSDHTLSPLNAERLASPLILKPLACANGQAVGLVAALRLQWPDVGPELPMKLSSKSIKEKRVRAAFKSQMEADFPPLNKQTNVLQACIDDICRP